MTAGYRIIPLYTDITVFLWYNGILALNLMFVYLLILDFLKLWLIFFFLR